MFTRSDCFEIGCGFCFGGLLVLVGGLDVVVLIPVVSWTASCMSEGLAVASFSGGDALGLVMEVPPPPQRRGGDLHPRYPEAMGPVGSGRVVMACLLVGSGVIGCVACFADRKSFDVQGT